MNHKYVLRFDEICLKKGNREFFEARLYQNLKDTISEYGKVRLFPKRNRVLIHSDLAIEQMSKILKRIAGICDFSPVDVVNTDLGAIEQALLQLTRGMHAGTFKLEVKRSYKEFHMNSMQLAAHLGSIIHTELRWSVDVNQPDHILQVDVHPHESYIYGERFTCMGGLPTGSSGKLISLLSGGIDSPVASYKMISRGCRITYVHFHNEHEDGKDVKDKLLRIGAQLSNFQPSTKLYMIPFGDLQRALIGFVPSKYRMIAYRRCMFRLASIIRFKEKASAYVTGDSVGQVASQTLKNLHVIHSVADSPVLSPLIGFNKNEIIEIARTINTFELSILPYSDCCSFLVDEHPETAMNVTEMEDLEANIPLADMIEDVMKNTKLYTYKAGKQTSLRDKGIFLTDLAIREACSRYPGRRINPSQQV